MHRLAALASTVVCALSLSACLPGTPNASAWREDARLCLDGVASDIATAQLVLRQDQRDALVGNYARTAVVEAEERSGTAAQTFEAEQPPPGQKPAFDDVISALDAATSVLTDVRIAVVAGHQHQYAALQKQLDKAAHQLSRATSTVSTPEPAA